jgi:hypothetical protein
LLLVFLHHALQHDAGAASGSNAAAAAAGGYSSVRWAVYYMSSCIMRCNTMPVQQAEAMQQLLQQVGFHERKKVFYV